MWFIHSCQIVQTKFLEFNDLKSILILKFTLKSNDAKNSQRVAQSSRALDKTYETETKMTLQRVPVWYRPNLKVNLERISTTLECQSWKNYMYLNL